MSICFLFQKFCQVNTLQKITHVRDGLIWGSVSWLRLQTAPYHFTLASIHDFSLVSVRPAKCPLKNGEGSQFHSVTPRRNSLISRTHMALYFLLVPHLTYLLVDHLLLSFGLKFKLMKYCSEFFFSFFKILFSDTEVFKVTIKCFLRSLFSLIDYSDTTKFHIISSLHLIKYWQNLSIQIK